MDLKKLVTYSFHKNVGPADRAMRVLSGLAVAGGAGYLVTPGWAAATLAAVGLAWTATGIVSRCGVYYLLGYSTCPITGARNPLA